MSEQTYVVLRSNKIFTPTTEFAGPAFGMHAAAAPEAMEVTRATLSPRERLDLRRDPRTRALAPEMPIKLIRSVGAPVADVTATQNAWGVDAVQANQSPFDGAGVTVAVLDTGIDPTHPAFNGVNLVRRNFTSDVDDDQDGHGTHCAGTIFGRDTGGRRIGVARGVNRALIGKVLGAQGGSTVSIAEAINWAVSQGAHVVSMSLGIDFPGYVDQLIRQGYDPNPATSLALEGYRANVNLFSALADFVAAHGAFGQATIIVAASGNESMRPTYVIAVAPPASATGIVSVAALGQSPAGLTVAEFSNTQADMAAPGVNIVSAWPGGGLRSLNGTSMATPHVAGVAALWAHRQLNHTGTVNHGALLAQVVASGTTAPLAPNWGVEDVGTGIVQAPLN